MEFENEAGWVTDDQGRQRLVQVLARFSSPDHKKNFVLFTDVQDPDHPVYAYQVDGPDMTAVSDPEDLEQCEEVLAALQEELDLGGEEEEEEPDGQA
jgi:uncharacterized protein YrzB (UPF0473 family)